MKKDNLGLLTLDQLKSLRPSLNEASGNGIFRKALRFYQTKLNDAKKQNADDPYDAAAKAMILDFLPKNSPPVKFIGSGVGRFAFASEDGRVCKFVLNKDSMYQNNNEIQTLSQYDYPCFTKMYDYDRRTHLGLELEAVGMIEDEEDVGRRMAAVHSFGDSAEDLVQNCFSMCAVLVKCKFNINRLSQFHDWFTGKSVQDRDMRRLAGTIMNPGNNQQAIVFNQLTKFYIDSGMLFGDLHIFNIGYAYRNGEIVLIPFDLGM